MIIDYSSRRMCALINDDYIRIRHKENNAALYCTLYKINQTKAEQNR